MSAQWWPNQQSHRKLKTMEDRLGRRLEREVNVLALPEKEMAGMGVSTN
jgi:hypothetical protein